MHTLKEKRQQAVWVKDYLRKRETFSVRLSESPSDLVNYMHIDIENEMYEELLNMVETWI